MEPESQQFIIRNKNMTEYSKLKTRLSSSPKKWLITGVAGFIGSNLLETLLELDQFVVGLDNFSTGHHHNLDEVHSCVSEKQWQRFQLIEGDIRSPQDCDAACVACDYVLHQAALGSVPRSIDDPQLTNDNNITGFLNMLVAARDKKVKRFVYAASSSTYGDHPGLPKVEERIGKPLSPYAVTKYVNELYGDVFARSYNMEIIGLRYFNIFGKRQDPEGAYAAVMPKWFAGLLNDEEIFINGTGETSRDFCYIDNCVEANLLSACSDNNDAVGQVYNVAYGEQTDLNDLFKLIREQVAAGKPDAADRQATHRDFRAGDVMHSLADISKANKLLGYEPEFSIQEGLKEAAHWYINRFQ